MVSGRWIVRGRLGRGGLRFGGGLCGFSCCRGRRCCRSRPRVVTPWYRRLSEWLVISVDVEAAAKIFSRSSTPQDRFIEDGQCGVTQQRRSGGATINLPKAETILKYHIALLKGNRTPHHKIFSLAYPILKYTSTSPTPSALLK